MVNEAQNPATGGIPKTEKEFEAWADANRDAFSNQQMLQAGVVRLSFKTRALNKNNPAAFAKAKQMHDRDMAELEAMFGPQLPE